MTSSLDTVDSSLPALAQAQGISVLAAGAGFEWDDIEGVFAKIDEELAEYREARAEDPCGAHAREELGDVLFSVIQLARKDGFDAEQALQDVCAKFRARWAIMERCAREELGVAGMDEVPRQTMEELWERAKAELRKDAI